MTSKSSASKLDKIELKKLMREEKAKRIESPLAKYNSIGQLICVVCNQIIKSELFWSAHVNSKSHLQQIEILKSTKAKQNTTKLVDETNSFKRPHPVTSSDINESKKAKLINNYNEDDDNESDDDDDDDDRQNQQLINKIEKMEVVETKKQQQQQQQPITENKNELPKGFFDDVKKDMQARNIDYNSTLDSEFAKFKAELQNEEIKNEIITELDFEVRDIDRDLEEVDELIQNWSRVESLHQRKENLVKNKKIEKMESSTNNSDNDDDDNDSDVDLDSVLNLTLRTKNRC